MAIQARLNHNASNPNPLISNNGWSEFSLINNNGGTQKHYNEEQALFHHHHHPQQSRYQSFLDSHMEKQNQETDHFIRTQNERLSYVLQEQSKKEMKMVLTKMETKALVLMKHKEEEMSKAMNKNIELEQLLGKLEVENHTWQRMAREKEEMVAKLNSMLEQRFATCHDDGKVAVAVEDEGSLCGGDSFPAKKMSGGGCCLNCGSNGETRVLFLPCRHLCCCTDCEAGLVLCPICNAPKKNRIEAFIF